MAKVLEICVDSLDSARAAIRGGRAAAGARGGSGAGFSGAGGALYSPLKFSRIYSPAHFSGPLPADQIFRAAHFCFFKIFPGAWEENSPARFS